MFPSSLAFSAPALALPPFLLPYFGAGSPLRFWAYALVLCVVLMVPRGSRRWGGFGFLGIAGALCVYLGMNSMIASVMPK